MAAGLLEHVNITVTDPHKTAQLMSDLFDWRIRWEGPSAMGGYTVHVGTDERYLAVYSEGDPDADDRSSYKFRGGLNHIGVVVPDIERVEEKVKAKGFEPHNHGDYEPGRRFYFYDGDGVEFEVVSYA